jgi:hypothetical protein
MNLIIIITILFSHAMAVYPFVSNLQNGRMPNTSQFAVISMIIYYDFGLVLESLGLFIGTPYFIPFFDAKPAIVLEGFVLIASAPWLFILGSKFTNKEKSQNLIPHYSNLKESTKTFFYLTTILISSYLLVTGFARILQGNALWDARTQIGDDFGPFVLVLYLPLHFLSFYTRQSDSTSKKGLLFSVGLTFATIISTLSIAQRTTMLLPVMILALFREKISLQKISICLIVVVIAASTLLPFFKWQKANSDDISSSIGSLITETIEFDFYRGGVLVSALEKTEIFGTKIMPYPMSGYVCGLFYYAPRSIAPFKGWSTPRHFTSIVDKTLIEDTNWGFAIGAIEEVVLNIGILLSIPCLFIYGMIMGLFDKASARISSLLIPTRLAGVWVCGYDFCALLHYFGAMAIVSLVMHLFFVQKPENKKPQILSPYGSFNS